MTEQELAGRFITEMQSFSRALRQRLARITDAATPTEREAAGRELRGLAEAMGTLCSSFQVTDCAALGATLAVIFERTGDAPPSSQTIATTALVLDYVEQRLQSMAAQQRVLPPTEEDRSAATALESSLLQADSYVNVSEDAAANAEIDVDRSSNAANGDMLELVRRFQASPLKRRDTPALQLLADMPLPPASASEPRHVTAEELDIIPDELKTLFVRETKEDLSDLHQALLHLEQEPNDIATVADMGRVAHKIKGAAATYGFDELATLTHIFEDHIKALQSRRVAIGSDSLGYLFRCLGLMDTALAAAEAQQPVDPTLIAQARLLYDELLSEAPLGAESSPSRASVSLPGIENPAAPKGLRPSEIEPLLRVDVARLDALMSQVSALTMNRATIGRAREDVVRLQSEMDLVLERLTQLSRQLTDLHPLVRHRAEHDMQPRLGATSSSASIGVPGSSSAKPGNGYNGNGTSTQWDELQLDRYTDFDDSLRGLSEAVADMTTVSGSLRILLHRLAQTSEGQETIAQQIQQDVMQIRLVPLQNLIPRLQFPARKLADDLGKAISFTVRGELTEIDRDVSEALAEPLSQLVRNAIVHGIESPEERRDIGKPEAGNVWLHAHYDGNEISIEIGDDGRGVNPNLLRASAITAGLLDPSAAQELSAEQALDFMFYPGITGLDQVGAAGGRGIGLDEVRIDIERLKGNITVKSQQGQGSVFHIRVPISLSIVHALHIHTQGQGFALPFSYVLRTLTVTPDDVIVAPKRGSETPNSPARRICVQDPVESTLQSADVTITTAEVPLLSLSEMLGYDSRPEKERLAVLLELGQRRLALAVEEVVEERDIVVRALPGHLRRKAIRGASVTSDGGLLLLLDVPELMTPAVGKTPPRASRVPVHPTETPGPRVLVVDDSVFIRRTLELTLSRAGYEVQTARDGVEALSMMMESLPRVLILDIEMPRLDGFELLSVLRGSEQFAGVRVAMLTSRGGERHRELALSLGADDYLVKPCPQELLLGTVQRLIMGAAVKA